MQKSPPVKWIRRWVSYWMPLMRRIRRHLRSTNSAPRIVSCRLCRTEVVRQLVSAARNEVKEQIMELRFLGFDQNKNPRQYKFDGLANGQPTLHFVVTADLTLFREYRI